MVLESTMICVDDSDYMRNGDFVPTRMAAVQDAVNIVCHTKTRANPENNVGLLTLASSKVLTTLTTDSAKLMSKMLACQPSGNLQLMSGLRKAHLALKHRQGKNHKMRIVVFVGSPLDNEDETEWVRLAKRMKKEKVNVDIVAFGDGSSDVLQKFVDSLNGREGNNTSHLIVVPQGTSSLSDALMASPVLQSEDGMPMGGGGFDFGIDPNDDPELALALRVSMEEQRTRQETEGSSGAPVVAAAPGSSEEQMLERALAISREQEAAVAGSARSDPVDFAAMTEEEQIAYAMQMSMQDSQHGNEGGSAATPMDAESSGGAEATIERMELDEPGSTPAPDASAGTVDDPAYIQSVLESLPAAASPEKKPSDAEKKPSDAGKKPSDAEKKPEPKN